jgi:Raf kinase inhibitor-like YbhB/YbcL family protein
MRRTSGQIFFVLLVAMVSAIAAQTPPQTPPPQTPPAGAAAPAGQRGGGGGRGRGVQVMTLSSSSWPDGAQMPPRFTQAGEEVSPALTWSNAPDTTQSFVLIVHDVDAAIGDGLDDVLHWMVWNIPATAKGLPEAVAQGPQLPDGTRQISVTGPYYRGPAAPSTGPVHHYVFELFALDATINVPPVGPQPVVTPATTRAAVVAAMATHVRGKAAMVALFRR